jgi:uncharacterized protein (DUF488 family)
MVPIGCSDPSESECFEKGAIKLSSVLIDGGKGSLVDKEIFTIGHSTHSIEEFIALLQAHRIEKVIDVRTVPKSRYCPQFNQASLQRSLKKAGIGYEHIEELGGFRHPLRDSLNEGWKNASFRGFADYMGTLQFRSGIEKLEKTALKYRAAILCAEAVPWRCHRSLIADALTVKKWKVFHIQSCKSAKKHRKTSFLKVRRGELMYPKES